MTGKMSFYFVLINMHAEERTALITYQALMDPPSKTFTIY